MKSKPFHRTLLIVCEGESTEPIYFKSLCDSLDLESSNIQITVSPLPKQEDNSTFELRTGGKKRTLKPIAQSKEDTLRKYEIESKFQAQPTRYVREAQMGLEDGTFDEVWAVFDKDGHPRQQEAFELGAKIINGRYVNIGFSSVSFERWLLLHFEQNNVAYNKSKCRVQDNYFECGTNTHTKDCGGANCICGRMTSQKYLGKNWNTKHVRYDEMPVPSDAYVNSVWLRNTIPQLEATPVYTLDAYTNLDRLVYRLNKIEMEIVWFNFYYVESRDIKIRVARDNTILELEITVKNDGNFILNEGDLIVLDASGIQHPINQRTVFSKHLSVKFDTNNLDQQQLIYWGYKISDSKLLLADVPA